MDERINEIKQVSEDARVSFGGLSAESLNWKPDAKSWSVAQCLDHLITINSLYFPLFEKLKSGPVDNTFWEKYSPLSGFFGKYLINALDPQNQKKTKTSPKAYPSSSEIDDGIVDRFEEHNRELGNHVANVSANVDLKTIVTSPLAGFVTYSLDDCLKIIVVHERRHLLQAKRVMESFESRL